MKNVLPMCAVLGAGCLFALEVDRRELERANATVEFENFAGTHTDVDSAAAIRRIGEGLASALRGGVAGDRARYALIHAVGTHTTNGFDADILIIGAQARVDHIDNIREIVAAYLSAAYGYRLQDARTIATFTTVYNAVYRADLPTFKARYKGVVTAHLSPEHVGIARRFDQWPGKTQLVIPLSGHSDALSAVDTGAISDKRVVERLREDPDKNVDLRRDMIDLKEREAQEGTRRAQQLAQQSQQAQERAAELSTQAQRAQAHADKTRREAQQAQQAAQNSPDPARTQEAKEKERVAERAQQEAQQAAHTAQKATEQAESLAREARSQEQRAQQKSAEAQRERLEVAGDMQRMMNAGRAKATHGAQEARESVTPCYGLKVVDAQHLLSEIVLVDPKTEAPLRSSSLRTVRNRLLYSEPHALVAIADTTGNGTVRLVHIDPKTLEVTKESTQRIAAQSFLLREEEHYYAVIDENGSHFLGRFTKNLELTTRSAAQVTPYTAVTVTPRGIMVQTKEKGMALLHTRTLADALPRT